MKGLFGQTQANPSEAGKADNLFGAKPALDKPGNTETKPLVFPTNTPSLTKPSTDTNAPDAAKGLSLGADAKPDPNATAAVAGGAAAAGGAATQVTEAEKLKEELA